MPRNKLPEKRERTIHVRLTEDLHKKSKIEVAENRKIIEDRVTQLIENSLIHKGKGRE